MVGDSGVSKSVAYSHPKSGHRPCGFSLLLGDTVKFCGRHKRHQLLGQKTSKVPQYDQMVFIGGQNFKKTSEYSESTALNSSSGCREGTGSSAFKMDFR